MTTRIKAICKIVIIIIAPAVMMLSFILHPHVGNPIDADFLEKLAAAVQADTTRWGIVHYLAGVGCGLMMLAFIAVRSHLRETASEPWSGPALPFMIMGSTLYALLPVKYLSFWKVRNF